MEQQLVVFDLANEQYGVDIAAVEGIIKLQTITAVPRAPQWVEGVTNLRGKVLPVIDLRKRFGLPPGEASRDMRIVVVEIPALADGTGAGAATVGIVVDAVSEVLRVNPDTVEPPSPIVTTADSAFIRGIAKVGERLVILLDLGKVLSITEQAGLAEMAVAA
jgi:purine-binding chemotaxis protein CheW